MARELPNSKRLEQSLLGSLMVYSDVWRNCQDYDLRPSEFYVPGHQKIYLAMEELAKGGRALELENVIQRLIDKDELEQAGGLEYCMSLMDGAISSANVTYYIETIKAKAQLRSLIEVSEHISSMAFESAGELDEVLDDAERSLLDVTRTRRGSEFESSSAIVSRVLEQLEQLKDSSGVTGLKTGFRDLDNMTNGLQNGDLIILAARPAMGKSALALNLANNAAWKNEGAVAVFSLEMPADSLIKRLLSCESKVFSDRLRNGKFTNEELGALYEAGNRLAERLLFIDDTSSIRVSQIFSKCRKLKSEYGKVSLIVIDYLQLISGNGRSDSRQQEVSEISRNLKILAKEMDCPVIALSQLSRKVEERSEHEPQLSDLRESGSIEQDADIVMFLYRESYYAKDADKDPDAQTELVDLSLAKHRNGAIGKIKLTFSKNISRFDTTTMAMEDPYGG